MSFFLTGACHSGGPSAAAPPEQRQHAHPDRGASRGMGMLPTGQKQGRMDCSCVEWYIKGTMVYSCVYWYIKNERGCADLSDVLTGVGVDDVAVRGDDEKAFLLPRKLLHSL
jgi:hypothetical protein